MTSKDLSNSSITKYWELNYSVFLIKLLVFFFTRVTHFCMYLW